MFKALQLQGFIVHPSDGYSCTAKSFISLQHLRIQPAMPSWDPEQVKKRGLAEPTCSTYPLHLAVCSGIIQHEMN